MSVWGRVEPAAKEALWLRRIIGEVFRPLKEPITLYSDSQSAIALTKDGSYHARTKHIDIRYHFIRFVVQNGSINLIYCPTEKYDSRHSNEGTPK